MMWRFFLPPLLALAAATATTAEQAATASAATRTIAPYAAAFDPKRDALADFAAAMHAAQTSHRRVLVIVGGDWCVWCFLLDRHLGMDKAAADTLYGGFEVLRVYYGDDNTNAKLLAKFPDFTFFPHFFIAENDGHVVTSLDANVIIADAKYDTRLIRAFVDKWKTPHS